jgi:hypothetical protein
MQLIIQVPDYCFPEAIYSFDVLFTCLGFSDYIVESRSSFENFVLINNSTQAIIFTIENYFFKEGQSYTLDLIPKEVDFISLNCMDTTHDLVRLYGGNKFVNGILSLDIVSGTFFVASRWEELVIIDRDSHGRFDESKALAIKYGFLHRPIINEYALLLKDILSNEGIQFSAKEHNGNVSISFDIDYVYKWKSWQSIFGNLIRKGSTLSDKLFYIKNFVQCKIMGRIHKDVFFSFDYIQQKLSDYNLKGIFYFMVAKTSPDYDLNDYNVEDPNLVGVIDNLLQNGHTIALHSSYHTIENVDQLKKEKATLEGVVKKEIACIRPHYLRILPGFSLKLIEEAGFRSESSMMYSRNFGFRCGSTHLIPYFDIKTRQITSLYMIPTIGMSSVGVHDNFEVQDKKLSELIAEVKKYGGQAQIIWHNSDLDTAAKREFFDTILKKIYVKKC